MQTIARYFIGFLLLLISHVIHTDPEGDKEIVRNTIRQGSNCDQIYSIPLKNYIADLEDTNLILETVRRTPGDSLCGTYLL